MKKELGKWLMDIAKYIVTALLLSSVFGDMQNPWIIMCVILSAAITLTAGLILIKDKTKEEKQLWEQSQFQYLSVPWLSSA